MSYQYIEVDPYKKPDWLLEINPRGLVPALRHGDWTCYESTVLMEYVRTKLKACSMKDADYSSSRMWVKAVHCYHETPRAERIPAFGLIM